MVEIDTVFEAPYAIAGSIVGTQLGILGYSMEKLEYDPMNVEELGVSGPAASIALLADYRMESSSINLELEASTAGSAALTYRTLTKLEGKYREWKESGFDELRNELDEEELDKLPEFENY